MGQKPKRTRYSKEFKLDVIQRSYQCENIRELADDLGIHVGVIYKWRADFDKANSENRPVFTGNGVASLSPEQAEIARLKRELADAKLERDILKKAITIFGKSGG